MDPTTDIAPAVPTPTDAAPVDALAAAREEVLALRGSNAKLAAELAEERREGARLRSMTGHFPDGMVMLFDHDLRYTAAFGHVAGRGPADYVGKTVREMIGDACADAREPWYREVLAGQSRVAQSVFEGRTFLVHGRPVPGEDGEIVGGVLVTQDVTARVEAEAALRETQERYRLLFERAGEAIYLVQADGPGAGALLEANEAAARMHGYTVEELGRMDLMDLLPPEPAARMPEALRGMHGRWKTAESVHVRKDGTTFPVGYTAGPMDLRGERCVLVFARDITEEKNAVDALRRAVARAEAANRELETFSYSVAHDLRGPLRGVSGFAQILLDDHAEALDEDGVDCLNEIQGSAQRMGTLIDALLSLSRVTRSTLRRERVSLSALARAVAATIDAAEPARAVTWVIEDDLIVEGDVPLVRSLLENLLDNAWKFTRHVAAPRIEVGVTQRDGAPEYFVRDNGAGFDMAYASKLFGAFQRLHTVSEFPGAGIGLATVHRIVRGHGGRVWAEGTVGGGATFHFTLDGAPETSQPLESPLHPGG